MKRAATIIAVAVCALSSSAQTYTVHLQSAAAGNGSVRVYQSEAISTLVNGKINVGANVNSPATSPTSTNARPTAEKPAQPAVESPADTDATGDLPAADTGKKVIVNAQKVQGYRVQVFTGGNSRNDKNNAEAAGEQIKRLFPDQPVYVHFYSPRWICRIGNYRTYEEAQDMLARVREAGFTQASLVKGTITPTD